MIKLLKIKDYTIIDEIETKFESGLNVITGETGAGKSLIIDAIDIALGAKASKDLIKTGKNRALIELEIEIPDILAEKIKNELEIEIEDKTLIITREITSSTSRIRANGILISQNELLEIRKNILDIHSQHQTYTYLQPKTHIMLLDNFGDTDHKKNLIEYKNLFKEYQNSIQKLQSLKETEEKSKQQADFLKFQIDEITSAEINDIHEFENLTTKVNTLANFQELQSTSYKTYEAINGTDDNIVDSLEKIKSYLDKAGNIDEQIKEISKNLEETILNLKETARELRNYAENLEYDEEMLNQYQLRLEILSKLKRKYGGSLEEVLNSLSKFEEEYNFIENSEEIINELEQKIIIYKEELKKLAQIISQTRKNLAQNLSNMVTKSIKNLEMPYAEFKVQIEEVPIGQNGIDNIEFMIITNPTESFKPLVKIASGGEISRIMLAIKTVFANSDDIMCVIFDEIDTGISGKTSQAIAAELNTLSKTHQILCITHQPIIASIAAVHLHVSKMQNETKFEIHIQKLDRHEREKVISKMLSGTENEESLQLAKELLARNY